MRGWFGTFLLVLLENTEKAHNNYYGNITERSPVYYADDGRAHPLSLVHDGHYTAVLDHHLPSFAVPRNRELYGLPHIQTDDLVLQLVPSHLGRFPFASLDFQHFIPHPCLVLPHDILNYNLFVLMSSSRKHGSELSDSEVSPKILFSALEVYNSWLVNDAFGYPHILFVFSPFILPLSKALACLLFGFSFRKSFVRGTVKRVPCRGVHDGGQTP